MGEITGPVIATTLVLVAVFAPVGFVSGVTGALYRQFAVTISVSVVISAVNALTLSPALCALMLRPPGALRISSVFRWFNNGFNFARDRYRQCRGGAVAPAGARAAPGSSWCSSAPMACSRSRPRRSCRRKTRATS